MRDKANGAPGTALRLSVYFLNSAARLCFPVTTLYGRRVLLL